MNATDVMAAADAMVSLGLRDLGYQYLEVDEPGFLRAANGSLITNRTRFPDGIKAVADYLHERGLKLGMYTSAGPLTCAGSAPAGSPTAGWAGSYGHECQDATQFAKWGVDYVFEDFCSAPKLGRELYPVMSKCLNATGREILFLMCIWGQEEVATWGGPVANAWRVSGDMYGRWDSIMRTWDNYVPFASYAGPGHWNFLDFLRIDEQYKCSVVPGEPSTLCFAEQQAHYSLWARAGSPIILGNDLVKMVRYWNYTGHNYTSVAKRLLLNPEVLAVSQDPLGAPAVRVGSDQPGGMYWTETWMKNMSDHSVAIVVFNRGDWAGPGPGAPVPLVWPPQWPSRSSIVVRDLWAQKDLGVVKNFNEWHPDGFKPVVPDHGVRMFKVKLSSTEARGEVNALLV